MLPTRLYSSHHRRNNTKRSAGCACFSQRKACTETVHRKRKWFSFPAGCRCVGVTFSSVVGVKSSHMPHCLQLAQVESSQTKSCTSFTQLPVHAAPAKHPGIYKSLYLSFFICIIIKSLFSTIHSNNTILYCNKKCAH